ncbi:mobilization protein [Mesorhizobium sp. RMAD-H1]|uniref:mobilization protein n=1 Tax=Mesorhizobium sp. RMAD-H1 TaxID=2587065 RepID=UPI0016129610|nr:mobilization protein [Mesorhizobium sp. RMAD-H1]MBB2973718.1 hypothetical protein [Mesorhizobium sp. RMAD-H1]
MLGNPLTLRLSPEKHLQYEDEAARRGKPLGTYLRERLEAGDAVHDELAAIRRELFGLHRAIDDLVNEGLRTVEKRSGGTTPLMLEILLLLRAVAGMDKLTMVKGELRRLGYMPWNKEEDQSA